MRLPGQLLGFLGFRGGTVGARRRPDLLGSHVTGADGQVVPAGETEEPDVAVAPRPPHASEIVAEPCDVDLLPRHADAMYEGVTGLGVPGGAERMWKPGLVCRLRHARRGQH